MSNGSTPTPGNRRMENPPRIRHPRRKIALSGLLCGLLILACLPGGGAAEELPVTDFSGVPSIRPEEAAFFFAQRLFEEGDYGRAITEYKRFCFLQPEHVLVPLARLKIGLAHCRLGEWDAAKAVFRDVYRRYPEDEVAPKALYLMGEALFVQRDFRGAIASLRRVEAEYPSSGSSEQASMLIGWSYAKMSRWAQAAQAFAAVRDGTPYAVAARSLTEEVKAGSSLPQRRPVLAGVLSALLPGAGQVYAGRYRDALAAFLLNAGFIAAIVFAFRARNWPLAAILLVVEAGWYAGTIYGSMNAIEKLNLQVKEAFVEKLITAHQFHLLSTSGT